MQLALINEQAPREFLGSCEVTRKTVRSILGRGVGFTGGYDYVLNPYNGCQFGCAYCYAVFFVADAERAAIWGNWVEVKQNALAMLRVHPDIAGRSIYVGSVTDPYQPIERRVRLTRSLLEFMSQVRPRPRVVIQTRSPLVVDDIAVFSKFESGRVCQAIGGHGHGPGHKRVLSSGNGASVRHEHARNGA
jgi:DNA repair photolyase